MEELKPCPFCGGKANITRCFGRITILCQGCDAAMIGVPTYDKTEDEHEVKRLTNDWNRRADNAEVH